jgi:hypothetical protein
MRISSRLDRHAVACAAGTAALLGGASEALADVVYSGVVNLNVPSTGDGVYLNVLNGATGTSGGSVPGWDVNPYSATGLTWFTPASSTTGGCVRSLGNSTLQVDNLPPGTLVGPPLGFGNGASQTAGDTAFLVNSDQNLVGFRFLNENTGQVHYGWLRMSLSGTLPAQPRTVVEWAYESTPNTPIAAGDTGGPVGPVCGDEGTGSCCAAGDTPFCEDAECCAAVCAVDAYCCEVRWDEICANAAYSICETCPPCGDPQAGSCCEESSTPYCSDAECCTLVCTTIDPFCCNVRWDAVCADIANSECDSCTNPPPPPACGDAGSGNCCERNGTPFCEDAECCATVCGVDPSCCETGWDEDCAELAGQLCVSCWSCGDEVTGSCCEANGTPYCNDSACCTLICGEEPFCCEVEWDATCAEFAAFFCTACPPANNDCGDAVAIGLGDTPFSTLGATTDGPDTPAECNAGTSSIFNDVWYLYTAGKDGTLTVSTCGQAFFDTKLALYTSCGGDLVACNDDGPGCTGFTSLMTAPITVGTTYVLRVGAWGSTGAGTGILTLSEEPLPPPACGDPGTGNCCEATGTPFCEDAECCLIVCGIDPFCCDTEWDSFCAGIAADECADCAPPLACGDPATGDCCATDSVAQIDVTGAESFAGIGNKNNTVLVVDLGGPVEVIGIGWDVTIQSIGGSWLSEAAVNLGSSSTAFISLRPGNGVDNNGGNVPTQFSSGGVVDLISLGLDFALDADGVLRLEFFDTFVDFPDSPDAIWVSGSLTVVYTANSTPFCDDADCCNAVCAVDPLCCEVRWDDVCAGLAAKICDICVPPVACGDPGTGNCCEDNGTPFCDDADCCTVVCAEDAFCCDVEWDSKCVALAEELCTICEPPPPPCPWDLNLDGQVGGADLGILLQNWGNPYGGADLGGMLQTWGPCPE